MQPDALQRRIYGLRFRIAFLQKRGVEFQDWFARLMRFALSHEFEPIRSYGPRGDLKCDGYWVTTGTVFQCYAPDRIRESALIKKITTDFDGARDNWGRRMRRWVLVHNDQRGLPARTVQHIDSLRGSYPNIRIETWGDSELARMKERLDLEALESLFGYASSRAEAGSLGIEDLRPVLEALQRREPSPGSEPVSPPSVEKLEQNQLSEDAAALLRWGRRKEALVARCFKDDPRPEIGELVAEAFRERYDMLKEDGLSPDEVLWALQQHAGGDMVGIPNRQGAVLAVLSYFFERCDIFEDPKRKL